jgi:hypothetical protein
VHLQLEALPVFTALRLRQSASCFLPGSKFFIRCRASVKFLGKIKVVGSFRDVHFSVQSQLKFLFELGPCREAIQTAVSTQIIVFYKLLPIINSIFCLKAHVFGISRIQYSGMPY